MEWIAQEDEKENQAVAGLCEAILSVAVFEFTFEQWEVVEEDIRAAEDRETALIKELDKLKEQNTTEKQTIKGEENELKVQDDTQSVANELRDLEEEMDAAEQDASMRAAGNDDTVQNSELNGAISKQTKKDKKREKRKMKKEEKIREKIAKEEEKIVQLYFKLVDKIMIRYTKDVKLLHKKEVKRRKQMEKTERKAQKMLEKEMKKMEKGSVKNEKKKKAQTMGLKEKHNDKKKSKPKRETGNNKGHEKKEAKTIDVIEAKQNGMKKSKTKKETEKNKDGKKKESMKIKNENIDKMDTTNDGKKNTISANIRAFFRIFSCIKRQEKDKAVV
ncbi:cylicin-1-like [Mytilus californianus]|uniref:cylicin-1-like n=1 Tax=Mytilus californianus TaxID=6549 RepID=UPI0022477658|nr:cylicin-1-like [Mytilus californianus]